MLCSQQKMEENWAGNNYYVTDKDLNGLIWEGVFFIFQNFSRGSVTLTYELKVAVFWHIEFEQTTLGFGMSAFSSLLC